MIHLINDLMSNVFKLLPNEFYYIQNQLSEGIIINYRKINTPFPNYINFSLKVDLLRKYEDKKGKYFIIKGVRVYDEIINDYTNLNIHIGYGLLLGYSTSIKELNPNTSKIIVENLNIEYLTNDEFENIKHLFTQFELKNINSNEVYVVELENKEYYHVFDLEGGDFIGIDNKKNVYKISHDPFEIILLKESLTNILKDLNRGKV